MKRATMIVLLLFGFSLAGCNTMHGLGKDISNLGGKIEQKSGEN